jgi:serine/threonine protein kinase
VLNNSNHLLGQTLGTCTLKRLIGRGGMGAVYLAQQSRPRRTVAVKVLLPNLIEPGPREEFLARFRREADAIAALDHINIMPIYEYGEQGETAYLVMPYVMGGTLRERLEAQRVLPIQDIVSIIEQTAAGLDCAHALGIIHRDLKPGNILFHADGRILIADFGLAKMLKDATEQESASAALTSAGSIIGTPEYLSPEQGTGNPIDYHTDVYSLGVVLYQMLAGRVPFVGPSPVAVAIKHAIEEPLPVTHFNSAVPHSVEAVVMKALAKAPEQRFSSAGEMARALRRAISNEGATTIWKAPDLSATIVPTTDPQSEPDISELEEISSLPENVAAAPVDNQSTDDQIAAESQATYITQPPQENNTMQEEATRITSPSQEEDRMQEKVAALPTLMTTSDYDAFHTSPTEEAPPVLRHEEPIQSFPTVVTQAEPTEENEFELEPKVLYQEVEIPAFVPETEQPHGPPVAVNTPVEPVRPLQRTRKRLKPGGMVLIGSLLALLLIGGGIAIYLHALPTQSASTQGGSKVIALSKRSQTAATTATTPATATPPPVAAPKAAITAGAALYSTPHPFTGCDTQGGHWTDASGTHVTCGSNGSEIVNSSGHLTSANLDKLAGNQTPWPSQNFIAQVQISMNPNNHDSAFGIDFQPQASDGSQGYFAYLLNTAGAWTFNHYDNQGNIMDTLVNGQLSSPVSTTFTLDIRVEGTSYAIYINGVDTIGRAETGSQYTDKIVGLAVDTNADVTFSNFAIYALS